MLSSLASYHDTLWSTTDKDHNFIWSMITVEQKEKISELNNSCPAFF